MKIWYLAGVCSILVLSVHGFPNGQPTQPPEEDLEYGDIEKREAFFFNDESDSQEFVTVDRDALNDEPKETVAETNESNIEKRQVDQEEPEPVPESSIKDSKQIQKREATVVKEEDLEKAKLEKREASYFNESDSQEFVTVDRDTLNDEPKETVAETTESNIEKRQVDQEEPESVPESSTKDSKQVQKREATFVKKGFSNGQPPEEDQERADLEKREASFFNESDSQEFVTVDRDTLNDEPQETAAETNESNIEKRQVDQEEPESVPESSDKDSKQIQKREATYVKKGFESGNRTKRSTYSNEDAEEEEVRSDLKIVPQVVEENKEVSEVPEEIVEEDLVTGDHADERNKREATFVKKIYLSNAGYGDYRDDDDLYYHRNRYYDYPGYYYPRRYYGRYRYKRSATENPEDITDKSTTTNPDTKVEKRQAEGWSREESEDEESEIMDESSMTNPETNRQKRQVAWWPRQGSEESEDEESSVESEDEESIVESEDEESSEESVTDPEAIQDEDKKISKRKAIFKKAENMSESSMTNPETKLEKRQVEWWPRTESEDEESSAESEDDESSEEPVTDPEAIQDDEKKVSKREAIFKKVLVSSESKRYNYEHQADRYHGRYAYRPGYHGYTEGYRGYSQPGHYSHPPVYVEKSYHQLPVTNRYKRSLEAEDEVAEVEAATPNAGVNSKVEAAVKKAKKLEQAALKAQFEAELAILEADGGAHPEAVAAAAEEDLVRSEREAGWPFSFHYEGSSPFFYGRKYLSHGYPRYRPRFRYYRRWY